MRKLFFSIYILLCCTTVTVAQSRILSPAEIYRQVVKSTVTIITDAEALGSGFYVAPNVVATNYHVIEGATNAKCVLTNTSTQVNVTGYVAVDKSADLILLKVTGAPRTPLRLAHGNVTTGQIIYAIGAPQGMEGTISDGIVSAVRTLDNLTFIQITAPISQGSSGGPIINRVGEVVGIATLIHSGGQNLNFAVNYSHLQTLIRRMRTAPTALAQLGGQPPAHTGRASTPKRQEEPGSFCNTIIKIKGE
ncbi:MAG: serine protease [Prevotellaceae bacterium]|nr:serine protease [Prevotellaceae bacterium]